MVGGCEWDVTDVGWTVSLPKKYTLTNVYGFEVL